MQPSPSTPPQPGPKGDAIHEQAPEQLAAAQMAWAERAQMAEQATQSAVSFPHDRLIPPNAPSSDGDIVFMLMPSPTRGARTWTFQTTQAPATPVPSPSVGSLTPLAPGAPFAAPTSVDASVEQTDAATSDAGALAAEAEGATPGADTHARKGIVSSAVVIMIGQLLSSVLGMARIETLNVLFWGTASGAFVFALRPIQQVSDLLVGSSVSGALIPTFVDRSAAQQREELQRICSTVANIVMILMAGAVIALFFLAPALADIYTPNDPVDAGLIATLMRIAAFALFGLGLYAVSSALLYALRDVVYPAFAPAVQHIGVILGGVVALLLIAMQLHLPLGDAFSRSSTALITDLHIKGANGLAVGLAVGSLAEFLVLTPALIRARAVWRPVLDLRHPAVRQIVRLYAPIAAGLLLNLGQQNVELLLIGRMPGGAGQNITALQSATTLVQFPVGLVSAALSFAVLPPLTAAATRGDTTDFKRTLVLGFRLGLLLMVPAMVGLVALDTPIVSLLFQHGTCQHGCTVRNSLALENYAYQLPFLALQQILIAAFYARKNTIVPVVVAILSLGFWAIVAVPFAPTIGLPAIAFANTALNSGQAIVLFILLTLMIGDLGLRNLGGGLARIGLAAAAMWAVCWAGLRFLPSLAPHLFTLTNLRGEALTVVVIGGAATIVYFALIIAFRVEEINMLGAVVRARLGGRK